MKKSALICFILTCLFVTALCRGNTYVNTGMTWPEARDHCMKHHKGLTSISNEQEDKEFLSRWCGSYKIWIGLHKDINNNWKWARGESATYFRWSTNPSGSEGKCVVLSETGWRNETCTETNTFFCSNHRLVVVKEKKTWEEAMEHCRDHNKDLVSLPSESAVDETLRTIERAQGAQTEQTERVWTGLRYLGDRWLWVSAHPVSYLGAPSHVKTTDCPTWIHRCGALSVTGGTVDGWDCADKLYFVCDDR